MKPTRRTKRPVSGIRQLTPGEIESLREDSRLSLEAGRILLALRKAKSRGATAAQLEELETKLRALEAEIKANDPPDRLNERLRRFWLASSSEKPIHL
jgi:chaperonin cofactor prefoldin